MNTTDLLGLTVKEVMTTSLFTVTKDKILKDVNIIFERENIHHIPVVTQDNKFLGIISKSDMLMLLDWGTRLNLPASLRKNTFLLTSNLAKDVMQTNVIKIDPNDTIKKCVQIFKENYFRALPVVGDNDQLLGMITTYDLMILAFNEKLMLNSHNS